MKILIIDNTEVKIDDEDFIKVSQYKWRRLGTYIVSYDRGRMIRMSRLIYGKALSSRELIDHIDRDTFNNQRCNLRICSPAENLANTPKRNLINPSSKYKGVNFLKQRQYYLARITFKYKTVLVWKSKDPIECAFAYNIAMQIIHPEFAYQNDVGNFYRADIEEHVQFVIEFDFGIKSGQLKKGGMH